METVLTAFACGALGALAFFVGPKAYTFVRAVTSGWNKDNIASRLAICKVCPRVKRREHVHPDGHSDQYLYCDECKCGSHHLAELHVKMGFNNISCPIGKFGKAEAMTVHEAHDILVDRKKKEYAIDRLERENMRAGRDRSDNGAARGNATVIHPTKSGEPSAQAQEMKRQTDQLNSNRVAKIKAAQAESFAKEVAGLAKDKPTTEQTKEAQPASRGTVWAKSSEDNKPALVGVDDADEIRVEENDDG